MEFNDWSAFMQQVQIHSKKIENKLLHRRYNDIASHVDVIKESLDKTLAWVAMQNQSANVDIVPFLDAYLKSVPEKDMARVYLTAALQEIKQLRGERQFWLKTGFSIGDKS